MKNTKTNIRQILLFSIGVITLIGSFVFWTHFIAYLNRLEDFDNSALTAQLIPNLEVPSKFPMIPIHETAPSEKITPITLEEDLPTRLIERDDVIGIEPKFVTSELFADLPLIVPEPAKKATVVAVESNQPVETNHVEVALDDPTPVQTSEVNIDTAAQPAASVAVEVIVPDSAPETVVLETQETQTQADPSASVEVEVVEPDLTAALILPELTEPEEEPEMPPAKSELEEWELQQYYTVVIPSLGVSAPVYMPSSKYWDGQKWDLLEDQMQVGLHYGTVMYPHSVSAGKIGNLFIAGHSSPPDVRTQSSAYGKIFERLPELKPGDIIKVINNARTVTYKVKSTKVVSPTDTSILASQNQTSLLTMITCFPIPGTSSRMIVSAELVE